MMEVGSKLLVMFATERARCSKAGVPPPKAMHIGANVWRTIKDHDAFRGKLSTLPAPLLGITIALADTPDYMGFYEAQATITKGEQA